MLNTVDYSLPGNSKSQQPNLFERENGLTAGRNGTFSPNLKESVHRWYPYLEGFASNFVNGLLSEFGSPNCQVHDPFGGTGTTVLVASSNNSSATYTEVNPFMRLVIECKTNILRRLSSDSKIKVKLIEYFDSLIKNAKANLPTEEAAQRVLESAFGARLFFKGKSLVEIVALKNVIDQEKQLENTDFNNLAKLVLASIGVNSSELKRAGDLRYRLPKELNSPYYSPLNAFEVKNNEIINDIISFESNLANVKCINTTALELLSDFDSSTDLIITSPPYLNGTNYFRNTKIELWLAGFIESEKELGGLRDQAMAAGINDISKRGRKPIEIKEVEGVAKSLDAVAYDTRIPEMVRRYFSDSVLWLTNSYNLLKKNGNCIVDIGDSRFAGVHVPVDEILVSIASEIGFDVKESRFVRNRKSKDGTPLKQVLLILKKTSNNKKQLVNKEKPIKKDFTTQAREFERLPFKEPLYDSRNWGHNLHSLCSYQGKLKPAIAHFLVKNFSAPGETVLDPMSGSGSIPLEALLQGRRALGNDLQELGYILTRAKVEKGTDAEVENELSKLLKYVEDNKAKQDVQSYSDFGFNGKMPTYFNEETYREVLAARTYLTANPCETWAQGVVYSSLLHILHGNRPYALSRNSHPVTPFAPTGDAEYRPLAQRLTDKVWRAVNLPIMENPLKGTATKLSFDDLPYKSEIDVVITSPPFAGSTKFFIANWMRLWMAGWEPNDFVSKRNEFLEYRQKKNFDVYSKFFECSAKWLKPKGRLIMHTGKTKSIDMAQELIERSGNYFKLIHSFDESVVGREKFGIRDQGATLSHQFIFFEKL